MAGQDASHLPEIPKLLTSSETFLADFYRLSTTRAGGMSIMPISWLSVAQYAELQGYDEFSRYFLHRVVDSLDPLFMENVNEQLKQNQTRKKP